MRYNFKTKPFKHQVIALKKCISQPYTALLLDPGLGKTKVSIDNLAIRNMRDKLSRVLILAPKVVLGNWEQEFDKHMPDNIDRYLYRLKGNNKDKRLGLIEKAISHSQRYPDKLHAIIMTYDSLSIRKGKDGNKYDEYYKLIKKFKPQAIVCDESQLIKSHNSQRSKSVYRIGKEASHRMILTGTMITKNPLDVFGQYRFLDDRIFGTRWSTFKNRYAIYGGFGGYQIVGWRDLDQLADAVHQIAVRMRKEDCLDLPPETIVEIPVELTDKTRRIYNQMKQEMIIELEGEEYTAEIAMVKSLRLQQIAGGFISKLDCGERTISPIGDYEKVNATIELAKLRIEEEHKVVIYAKYVWELKQLYERFVKEKLNPLLIYGKSKDDYVDKAKYLFQNDKDYPVIIMQVSKGIGIDLYAADIAIFHSLSHRYDDFKQCKDRISRIGQTSNRITYYVMLAENTIDNHIYKSVLNKQDFSRYVQDHKYEIFE